MCIRDRNNEFVRIANGALKFTCAKDGHVTKHDYPRATDPASQRALTVTNVTTDTFDVKILDITPSTITTVHTFVSAVANSVTHGGDYVQIVDNSLTFTCSKDSNATQHSYPRPGTDPKAGKSIAITAVSLSLIHISEPTRPY